MSEFLALCEETDPHPRLEWVRANLPVLRSPSGEYVTTTYAGCRELYDIDSFRAVGTYPGAETSRVRRAMSNSLTLQNPPEHTQRRKQFTRDFTVRRIETVRPSTEALCAKLLDEIEEPLRDGLTIDAMDLVRQVPLHVIAAHLGISEQNRREFFSALPTILGALAINADAATLAAADDALERSESYLTGELSSMAWSLAAAGTSTTTSALGSGILALLRYPDQAGWLEREPGRFAEEVLRHESPSFVSGIPKIAVQDVEIDGTVIPEGSLARTMLVSACRDSKIFEDPHRFDPARDNRASLAFGAGPHLCLGANLTRMELTTLLPMLHRRFPGLEPAGEPRWQPPVPVRGLSYLPVRLRR